MNDLHVIDPEIEKLFKDYYNQRKCHNEFSHGYLRFCFLKNELDIYTKMMSRNGKEYLSDRYEEIRLRNHDVINIPVSPSDFEIYYANVYDSKSIIVVLPTPILMGESFMICAVTNIKSDESIKSVNDRNYFSLDNGSRGWPELTLWKFNNQRQGFKREISDISVKSFLTTIHSLSFKYKNIPPLYKSAQQGDAPEPATNAITAPQQSLPPAR